MINADEIKYKFSNKKDKVRIAVLDSGIDVISNINLSGRINLIQNTKFVDDDGFTGVSSIYEDETGHGTAVAGIIGARAGYGINKDADIYSVKVLDQNNTAPLSKIIEGIYWCIDNKINIINMSFGTSVNSPAMYNAIRAAYDNGILMVAAAGNSGEKSGQSTVEYPAAYNEVIAVSGVNSEAHNVNDSSTGEQIDICAPGENIKTTGSFGTNISISGTIIATPHVTGVASLIWQKDLTKDADFVRQLLELSANKIGNEKKFGRGLLDANYALNIYETFEKNYVKRNLSINTVIPENTSEIKTVDEDTLAEAR